MSGELLLVNPKKRKTKRRTTRKTTSRRRRNPASRSMSYKRNPAGLRMKNIVGEALMPAATAAGGALGLDLLMGFVPLPQTLKTGPAKYVVKSVGAIGMGMLAGMVVKPQTAKMFTTGALTVTMYDAARSLIAAQSPAIAARAGWTMNGMEYMDEQIDGIGYYGAGYSPNDEMGYYQENDPTMGYYEENDDNSMGLSLEDELEL